MRPAAKSFWRAYGVPHFPDAGERDAVGFEVERGSGHTLAELDPLLLPDDESSRDYERLVLGYADRAGAFIEEHMPLILEALSEPYRPSPPTEISRERVIDLLEQTIRDRARRE